MMIDWAIVISTAVGFMLASITKVGEGFVQKAGEDLFDIVKKKFKGDKESENALSNFQQKPERYKDVLVDILKERVAADKSFGEEIRKIVEKTPRISSGTIIQTASGIGNSQAANNSQASSNVTINKK